MKLLLWLEQFNHLKKSITFMSDLTSLSARIKELAKNSNRVIVAIAGPPGSGKSTVVEKLKNTLDNAVVVPMDGFHLDNIILEERNLMPLKGSPQSFDADGYVNFIFRLKDNQETVLAPIFDRERDLSRAGAIEVTETVEIILTEGNYLLLEQSPWNQLGKNFDLTVFLDVPSEILRERLVKRWLNQGLSFDEAVNRAESNDLINASLVNNSSGKSDLTINNF
jgi:pantothenate kinase